MYKRLKAMEEVDCWWFDVEPNEDTVFQTGRVKRNLLEFKKPDVLLVPADRAEMVPVAMAAYYLRIPVFHLYAGVGTTGTYDDLNRRVISSYSYMLLCEDERARRRLIRTGEEGWRVKVVGATHNDDLVIDEAAVPLGKDYDLVLVNGNPADPKDEMITLKHVMQLLHPYTKAIWIEPSTPLRQGVKDWMRIGLQGYDVEFVQTLSRPLFLGLMRKSERFITNSSSAIYEAPVVAPHTKLVKVGQRNAERVTVQTKRIKPAADLVADLLANAPLYTSKMLKEY